MKVILNSKYNPFLIVLFLFFKTVFNYAQEQELVNVELDSILSLVDQQFEKEKYKEATLVLDSLKHIKGYTKKFDKLALNLREAHIFYKTDKEEKAIYLFLEGVKKLKDYQNSRLYWLYVKSLGNIYKFDENYEKSDYYLSKALLNAILRKDTTDIVASYFYKGTNFKKNADSDDSSHERLIDSASYYYKKAISYPMHNSTKPYLAKTYNNLGLIESDNDNLILAKEYYTKSQTITKNDTLSYAITMLNLANVFYDKKDYKKAIIEYKKGYDLVKNNKLTKVLEVKWYTLQNISWAYNELGEYKKAYEYQELSDEFKDSLSSLKRNRDVAAIEAKYKETQKTAAEKTKRLRSEMLFYGLIIVTLLLVIIGYLVYKRLRFKQLKTENKISGLKFKALNAQMNPHFINNLLIAVQDLIDSNKKDAAIVYLNKFNKLTNLVLQVTKTNLIGLRDEITMLKLYLDLQQFRFNQKFEYVINVDCLDKKDLEQIRIPPLILQPLVENSIVHGFRNNAVKGKIMIDFKYKNNDYLLCTIIDNGNSKPNPKNSKLYKGSGISLKNISERLQLINGEKNNKELLSFSSIKNKTNKVIGSKTELVIPIIYN